MSLSGTKAHFCNLKFLWDGTGWVWGFFVFRFVLKPSKKRFAGAAEAALGLLLAIYWIKRLPGTRLCALAEFVCFQFSNQLSRGGNGVPRCQSAQIFIGKVKPLWKVSSNVWKEWMSQPCKIRWDVVDMLYGMDVSLQLLRVILTHWAASPSEEG